MTPAEELVQLSRELGREERQLAILGEGNVSCDLGDGTFWVKASGTSLGTLGIDGLSRVSHARVDVLLDRANLTEQEIEDGLVACLADPAHKKPSVETFLHSLCLREPGVKWTGHTPKEVLNIMLMLDKWARVLLGTFAAGGPNFVSEEDAEKIDRRLDEAYRRKMIAAKA